MKRSTPPRRLTHFLLMLVALLLAQAVHAQRSEGYSVEIEGAGPFTRLLTDNLEISRHSGDADISDEELQRLVAITPQQIRELLATEGYFSATVQSSLDLNGGRRVARFGVEPGEPVRVDSVDIRFSGHIAGDPSEARRIERLRRQWGLKPGERFRQAAWTAAKNDLLKGLLNRDYPAARIADSQARIDPEQGSARLTVNADSGPAFTFDELRIHGLQRYPRSLIDELNPIKPGEPYSQEKLNELQSRLLDSGYFRSAFATIEVDPEKPDQATRVPVNVDVTENERKRLSFGIGFSTDAGARLQVRWLDRQFMERNRRLEADLNLDRQTRRIGADLYFPTLQSGWQPSTGSHYERTDIAGVLNDKFRLYTRLTSPDRNDQKIWGLTYYADRETIAEQVTNNRQAVLASWTYLRRRLDNDLAPRRGYVASVDLGAGLAGTLPERSIVRALARGLWLVPFEQRWQAVLRAQAGQVFGPNRDEIPDDLLFRTGGDQSVRGYAFNTLGVAENGGIVGGKVFALLSAELVYRITPQWGAAVFSDAGNAALTWSDFHFARGTGVGARWRSPLGPVNFDLAFAHETRKPRLHFSIGYGF